MNVIWIVFKFVAIFWITAVSENLIEVGGSEFTGVDSFDVAAEVLFFGVGVGVAVGAGPAGFAVFAD